MMLLLFAAMASQPHAAKYTVLSTINGGIIAEECAKDKAWLSTLAQATFWVWQIHCNSPGLPVSLTLTLTRFKSSRLPGAIFKITLKNGVGTRRCLSAKH